MLTGVTGWLVRRFVPRWEDSTDPGVRACYGALEAWISIVGNVVLTGFKFAAGLALNSIALLADAVHTLADAASSVVVLVGFRIAGAPPDDKHPFGHGRTENVITVVVAVMLVLVGLSFGQAAVGRLTARPEVRGNLTVTLILLVTAAFKEWLARFSFRLGEAIRSTALAADAWHHRTDAIATVLVVAAMAATLLGYPLLDPILGLVVAGFIVWTGLKLGLSAGSALTGEAPDAAFVEQVCGLTRAVAGVRSLHKVMVHDYVGRIEVTLHIQVDGGLTVAEAHAIAGRVKHAILEETKALATVHVEPDSAPQSSPGVVI